MEKAAGVVPAQSMELMKSGAWKERVEGEGGLLTHCSSHLLRSDTVLTGLFPQSHTVVIPMPTSPQIPFTHFLPLLHVALSHILLPFLGMFLGLNSALSLSGYPVDARRGGFEGGPGEAREGPECGGGGYRALPLPGPRPGGQERHCESPGHAPDCTEDAWAD